MFISNVKHKLRDFGRLIRLTIKHGNQVSCNQRAAALAYTSLLSLVPLMTVGFAIFSAFPEFKKISGMIQDFIFSNFVPATGSVVQNYLQEVASKAAGLSTISIIFIFISAIAMLFTLEHAFNAIWEIPHRRRLISALTMYWSVLTLAPLLLGAGFAVSSYLTSLKFSVPASQILGMAKPLLAATPFVLSLVTFTFLYAAIPNHPVPTRNAVTGGIVAAILFECVKYIFALYVTKIASYEILYGAIATIPIFLIWIYICWLIILWGAVLSYVLTADRATA